MHPEFWHKRWQKNEIGFHEDEGSALLKSYFSQWQLPNKAKVFLPLCGKTRDIAWLLSHGVDIVAVELSKSAVDSLFAELGVTPTISECGTSSDTLHLYKVENLSVYVGDFFALQHTHIGHIDAVYDRAALVALPSELRVRYTQHLLKITRQCPQFLVCYDYDQALFNGPPFSVNQKEVQLHYANVFNIQQIHYAHIQGGFRGQSEVFEAVYLLRP